MKRIALLISILLLVGCAETKSNTADIHLVQACKYFAELQQTQGYDNRRILLSRVRTEFRKAAFSADSARYEVLAEHTESYLSPLGNLLTESKVVIEKFCKGI